MKSGLRSDLWWERRGGGLLHVILVRIYRNIFVFNIVHVIVDVHFFMCTVKFLFCDPLKL